VIKIYGRAAPFEFVPAEFLGQNPVEPQVLPLTRRTHITSVLLLAVWAAGCGLLPGAPPTAAPAALPTASPTAAVLPTEAPTATELPTPEPTQTETPLPTATEAPTPTATPSVTPLPAGFVPVPDVTGLHYRDARSQVLRSGLNFVYHDVLDLGLPVGTILAQDPLPGSGARRGSLVHLLRSFVAPPALVGEICYPLRLISTSGRLLFYVDLEEQLEYEIRTDFPYGTTSISDSQMFLLDSFENEGGSQNSLNFLAPFTARYVLSLGPYSLSQSELDQNPGGISVGCLWVIPLEEEAARPQSEKLRV